MSYSGGALRKQDSTLMLHGGGGPPSTWAGNDIRSLRLQDNAPAWGVAVLPQNASNTWSLIENPNAPSLGNPWLGYLKDGKQPNTGHTNRSCQFVSRLNTFFNFTRTEIWPHDDFQLPWVDSVSFNNGTAWNPKGTNPDAPQFNANYEWSTCQDISENIYCTGPQDFNLYVFTPDWAGQMPVNPAIPSGQFSVVSALRGGASALQIAANDRYVFSMDKSYPPPDSRAFSIYYTIPGGAVAGSNPAYGTSYAITPATDATTIASVATLQANWGIIIRSGFVWDPGLKAFLIFWDDGVTAPVIFKLTPTFTYPAAPTFTLAPMSLGGTFVPSPTADNRINTYSRMQYVPNLRGVVIASACDTNVYFVKTVAG
jgi:hypothetical protein